MKDAHRTLKAIQAAAVPIAMIGAPFFAVWVALRGRGPWVRYIRSHRVEARLSDVFQVLDPASPRFGMLREGWRVEPLSSGVAESWLLTHPDGEAFVLTILERSRWSVLAYAATRPDGSAIGALQGMASRFELSPHGEGTRIELQENLLMLSGIGALAQAFHELVARAAIRVTLVRAAIHAAEGPSLAR